VFFELSGAEYGGWSLAGQAQLAFTGLYDEHQLGGDGKQHRDGRCYPDAD